MRVTVLRVPSTTKIIRKCKGKGHPRTGHEGPEGE